MNTVVNQNSHQPGALQTNEVKNCCLAAYQQGNKVCGHVQVKQGPYIEMVGF